MFTRNLTLYPLKKINSKTKILPSDNLTLSFVSPKDSLRGEENSLDDFRVAKKD